MVEISRPTPDLLHKKVDQKKVIRTSSDGTRMHIETGGEYDLSYEVGIGRQDREEGNPLNLVRILTATHKSDREDTRPPLKDFVPGQVSGSFFQGEYEKEEVDREALREYLEKFPNPPQWDEHMILADDRRREDNENVAALWKKAQQALEK